MRSKQIMAATAVALLAGIAACTGGRSGTVYNSSFTVGYDPRSLSAAMSRAPLLVETVGTPTEGQAEEDVSRATVQALRQRGPAWLPGNFTASPVDAGNGPYRLRIAYAMPLAFDRQRVCKTGTDTAAMEAERRGSDAGSTRTVASLCRGERTLGIAEGSPGSEAQLGDDDFARFIGHLSREAMPRRNPVMDDDCVLRSCD